jgi:hypothetical protein
MFLIVNIDTLLYYLNEKFGSLYFIILYELVHLTMLKVQD